MAPLSRFGAISCLLSLIGGVRLKRERKEGQDVASILGFGIRNFRADASDFVIFFRSGTDESSIEDSCKGRCHLIGKPGSGGVAFAAVRGKDALAGVVQEHPGSIESLQVDDVDYPIPELDDGIEGFDFPAETSWGLSAVNQPGAIATGKGVHIYIQDTGIRATHEDFGGRVVPTIDLTSGWLVECDAKSSECSTDTVGHGTHCAGSAGGNSYGVAPDATLHAVKTLAAFGGIRSWQYSALDWITTKGQRPAVVSMSLGGHGRDEGYVTVLSATVAAGVTVVVAAGNFNSDSCNFSPAFAPQVITVAASNISSYRADYSNFGACNNIFAPGTAIVSASHSSDTETSVKSGTSMACPHVSGAVALILQNYKNAKPSEIMASFQRTGKKGVISGLAANDPDLFLTVDHY